jgi:hypothetical protein
MTQVGALVPAREPGRLRCCLADAPPWCRRHRALPAPSANEAGGHRGRTSSNTGAGAATATSKPASFSPAVPSTCPKQRFTTVANGQQWSVAVCPELRQRPSMGGATVLPKLGVQPGGPCLKTRVPRRLLRLQRRRFWLSARVLPRTVTGTPKLRCARCCRSIASNRVT